MSDYDKIRCPKCGFYSENPDTCDSCGVIFAKLRMHEVEADFGGETYSPHPFSSVSNEEEASGGFKLAAIILLVVGLLGAGGWYSYERFVNPEGATITSHERLIRGVRQAFDTPKLQPQSDQKLESFRQKASKLKERIVRLPKPAGSDEELRRAALVQANALLVEALSSSSQVLHARFVEKDDPFFSVEDHLALARADSKRRATDTDFEDDTTGPLVSTVEPGATSDSLADRLTQMATEGPTKRERERQQMLEAARSQARALLQAEAQRLNPKEQIAFEDKDSLVIVVTPGSFEELMRGGSQPVFVEFWAPWSGPCKAVAPIVNEIATEFSGRVKVGRANVDENRELATRFNVTAVPTFILFKGGAPVDRVTGALPKETLRRFANGGI